MQVILEPVNGKGLKIPIDKAIIFIGRHPDCDIVITRSRTISRKHCAIVQVNDSLVLRDLGSTNGVRVNGKRVKKEARFTAGDTVMFGDLEYNVKKIKAVEPEKRPNRDHPQDARAGGAIPLRAEVPSSADDSQEMPVPIREDESYDEEESASDTPDSMAEVSPESLRRGAPLPDSRISTGKSTKGKGPTSSATHEDDESGPIPLAD